MYVSTSIKGFDSKPKKGDYPTIEFVEQDCTIPELYEKLINGHSIQCCFGVEGNYNTDGLDKKKMFQQTNIVSVDLDDILYCWDKLKALISSDLPTMMYTTFRHRQYDEKGEYLGNRYRLLYVFDEPIYSFELYAALYNAIALRLDIEITDNCGRSACQMMHGTNKAGEYFNSKLYNKVFSFSSFLTEEQLQAISNTHSDNKSKVALCNRDTNKKNPTRSSNNDTQSHMIDERIIFDAEYLPYKRFLCRYYGCSIDRTEKPEWIDGLYQFIESDYIRTTYLAKKIKDGNRRKDFLFKQALKRRYIKKDIDINVLFINMVFDYNRFVEKDDITISDLVRLTTKAYEATIYEDSVIIQNAKKKAPKCGIILKRGTYNGIGDYMHKLSLVKESLGEKRSRMTQYRERKKAGAVVARNTSKIYAEIYALIDTSLSRNENFKALKERGYKIGKNKVSELLNKKVSNENGLIHEESTGKNCNSVLN